MNRESRSAFVQAAYGFVYGGDQTHYLRRDGFEAELERETPGWRAGVGWRDQLESPLATRTTWNLFGRALARPAVLGAVTGRARELSLSAGARLPVLPLRAELAWQTSGQALGSAFEYRRWRVAAGGDFSLGGAASLVTQAMYGRATGAVVPQAAFYLGGGTTLRSLDRDALGGTGVALARVDLIGAEDVLSLLHLHHSESLRLQPGLFAASGAAWGPDPYGGPGQPGVDWPERSAWLSEIGATLHYDLGPLGTRLIAGWVWPLGPAAGREAGVVFEVTRPLDLLRAPREE